MFFAVERHLDNQNIKKSRRKWRVLETLFGAICPWYVQLNKSTREVGEFIVSVILDYVKLINARRFSANHRAR